MTIRVHAERDGARVVTIDDRSTEDDSIRRSYSRIRLDRDARFGFLRSTAKPGRGEVLLDGRRAPLTEAAEAGQAMQLTSSERDVYAFCGCHRAYPCLACTEGSPQLMMLAPAHSHFMLRSMSLDPTGSIDASLCS